MKLWFLWRCLKEISICFFFLEKIIILSQNTSPLPPIDRRSGPDLGQSEDTSPGVSRTSTMSCKSPFSRGSAPGGAKFLFFWNLLSSPKSWFTMGNCAEGLIFKLFWIYKWWFYTGKTTSIGVQNLTGRVGDKVPHPMRITTSARRREVNCSEISWSIVRYVTALLQHQSMISW